MKKIFVIAFLLVAGFSFQANAQTLKFGHIDIEKLIEVMPERSKAKVELEKTSDDLQKLLETMQSELETMIKDYTANKATMSELVSNAKVEDINAKQQRIETFRAQAQQQLQQKNQELVVPIYTKADSVISVVAKEQGLIYVFDISPRVVLYQSPQSLDILPLVKKKLGIE